jgi:hypothetical protein
MKESKFKTITFPFEGYNFEIMIEYHINMAGIFLIDKNIIKTPSKNVNQQEFYHHLNSLQYAINRSEHDDKIKEILIRELKFNNCSDYDRQFLNKMIALTFLLIASFMVILWI